MRMHSRKTHEPYEQKIHPSWRQQLEAAVSGEALETMVELCLWPSMVLLHKLAIHSKYILFVLHTADFYALGLQKREKT
jgi:hypothetical protein